MNNNYAILKLMSIPAGRWMKVQYTTDVTLSAKGRKAGVIILKKTTGTFRTGINYANTKQGKAKLAEGKDIEKLPWGKYKEGTKGRIIEHTNSKGQYNMYARLYSSPNKPKSSFFINGVRISKEDLRSTGYVPDSYFTANHDTGCFTINLNNLELIQ